MSPTQTHQDQQEMGRMDSGGGGSEKALVASLTGSGVDLHTTYTHTSRSVRGEEQPVKSMGHVGISHVHWLPCNPAIPLTGVAGPIQPYVSPQPTKPNQSQPTTPSKINAA